MRIFLMVFIGVFCFHDAFSKEEAKSDTVRINALEQSTESLRNSVKKLDKSYNELVKNDSIVKGILPELAIVDTSSLNYVKRNPQILYDDSFFKGKHHGLNGWIFACSLILFVLFMFFSFWWVSKTSLCRDESYYGDELVKLEKGTPFIDIKGEIKKLGDEYMPPFSYARVQMFWWTIIILGLYIIFFGLTGYLLPLNSTSVILLGLGVGVLVAGRLIDKQQIDDKKIPMGARSQDRNNSRNFFVNILSDEKGVSLHRFQTIVFNVVFGIGFIGYFFKALSNQQYPFADFNEWQFALLGISASAYLGLKAAENKNQDPTQVEEKKAETPKQVSSSSDTSNSEQFDR